MASNDQNHYLTPPQTPNSTQVTFHEDANELHEYLMSQHLPLPPPRPESPLPSTRGTKRTFSDAFENAMDRMQFRVAPIRSVPEGEIAPDYPATLLSYYLLNEAQLDRMAVFYHQDVAQPTAWTHCYPGTMDWDTEFFDFVLETRGPVTRTNFKRQQFGRFIGLHPREPTHEELDEKEAFLHRKERRRIKTNIERFDGRHFGSYS